MFNSTFLTLFLLATSAVLAPEAFAQFDQGALPSAATIAAAKSYRPPLIGSYAAKLAQQPDMSGEWSAMEVPGGGAGPTFDPVNTWYPPQPLQGEQLYGPIPGTYVKDIPFNAEWRKRYQDLVKETTEGKSRDDFPACVPYGVPRMLGATPVPMDIIQSPDVMIWFNYYGRTERRIFMDGRAHPKSVGMSESVRTYSGHSIGHWEGHTLVVDTINMMAGYLDETPVPYSDQLHMIERLRLVQHDILEDRITLLDPVALTGPWVVTRYYKRQTGLNPGAMASPPPPSSNGIVHRYFDLVDQPCVPNVRMDENGFQVAILPQEMDAPAASPKETVR